LPILVPAGGSVVISCARSKWIHPQGTELSPRGSHRRILIAGGRDHLSRPADDPGPHSNRPHSRRTRTAGGPAHTAVDPAHQAAPRTQPPTLYARRQQPAAEITSAEAAGDVVLGLFLVRIREDRRGLVE